MSFTVSDLLNAVFMLLCLKGVLYVFLPKAIQSFALNCIIEADPRNLRLFGIALILCGLFLKLFIFPATGE